VVYAFRGGTDGSNPDAGLVRDSLGNLYGTTHGGGDASCKVSGVPGYGCGTVFKVDARGKETVLYAFTGGTDGALPVAPVVRDTAGDLYGTTEYGDQSCTYAHGCGTVFRVDTTGKETVLYAFTNGMDGGFPQAGLALDEAGNLYGTTENGGTNNKGTVFKIDVTGQYSLLYSFSGGADGSEPFAGVILDSAGNLYGTTTGGGAHNYGTIFELSPAGVETVLYSFTGERSGWQPFAGLLRDSAGNLYGTTYYGGRANAGVVFKFKPGNSP
jgi:uncharacterized repeat protein (TIGR03803 family)